jgi:hypothetical protein
MKVIVNSNIRNIKTTIEKINEGGILDKNPDVFYFIVGGSAEPTEIGYRNVFFTDVNSFDLTGLIYLIENDYNLCGDESFFYTHDTCFFGDRFLDLLNNSNLKEARLFEGANCSMHIGIYTKSIIEKHKDEILKFKNTNDDITILNAIKNSLIHNESFVLFDSGFLTGQRQPLETKCVYNNNVPRLVEYFPELDFYKFKANWQAKQNYEINL